MLQSARLTQPDPTLENCHTDNKKMPNSFSKLNSTKSRFLTVKEKNTILDFMTTNPTVSLQRVAEIFSDQFGRHVTQIQVQNVKNTAHNTASAKLTFKQKKNNKIFSFLLKKKNPTIP